MKITFEVTDEQYAAIPNPEEFAKKQFCGEADYRIREAGEKEKSAYIEQLKTLPKEDLAAICETHAEAISVAVEPIKK
mgnify:CR=1